VDQGSGTPSSTLLVGSESLKRPAKREGSHETMCSLWREIWPLAHHRLQARCDRPILLKEMRALLLRNASRSAHGGRAVAVVPCKVMPHALAGYKWCTKLPATDGVSGTPTLDDRSDTPVPVQLGIQGGT